MLEDAWVRQLISNWRQLNATYFKNALQLPTLQLMESEVKLGLWNPRDRTLSLSRKLCVEKPWGVVLEVLKHEMAHQFVHEVLEVHDETAHGPAFAQVCAKHGIDAQAAGLPNGEQVDDARVRVLQRVSKLLALSGSQNEHEAQAAMSAAQRLMLQHNIDIAGAQQRYGFRHLGGVKSRTFEPERRISVLLGRHFFVEAIWVPSFDAATAKSGRVLEVTGAPENLDMAEYVYGFLTATSERLWREHKRAAGIKRNAERIAFCSGVIQGFADTLEQKRKANAEQGLVWLGDADLQRFHRARNPYISHSRHTLTRGDARQHGREAGRKLVLHKPMHERSNTRGFLN